MKTLKYKIKGYVKVYNPLTEEYEEVENNAIVTIQCNNQNDLDTAYYNAEKVSIPNTIEVSGKFDEEAIEPTAQDDTDAMLIDHEYRLTLLELGLTE